MEHHRRCHEGGVAVVTHDPEVVRAVPLRLDQGCRLNEGCEAGLPGGEVLALGAELELGRTAGGVCEEMGGYGASATTS